MNYIVLDLEFNQPFLFKSGAVTQLNPSCPFEIIQIGAIKLDEHFQIVDRFNCLIKPQIYTRIHPVVEKMTAITINMLEDCPYFKEVYRSFVQFIGKEESIFCVWGNEDMKSLYINILYYQLNPHLIPSRYINIQPYACDYLHYDAGKAIGLKNAVILLDLPIDSDFHDALNDAEYTAKIFQIVHPEKIEYETFSLSALKKERNSKIIININALIQHFERQLGHPLTDEQIKMLTSAYKLGRSHAFDINNKKRKFLLKERKK